jgi:hypothetical protein
MKMTAAASAVRGLAQRPAQKKISSAVPVANRTDGSRAASAVSPKTR